MSFCPTCGHQLAANETSCPRCADPETTRTAGGRQDAPYQQPPAPPQSPYQPAPQYAPYEQPPPPQGPPPQQWQQQPPWQQQQPPPRPPSPKGRLVAMIGGGAALLVLIGVGAWAVTSMGSGEGDDPVSRQPAEEISPTTTPSGEATPTTEPATEPSAEAPEATTEPAAPPSSVGTSTTYDLASGSETINLDIVADSATTVTASPDSPEDITLSILGPQGAEVCSADITLLDEETCTLPNPQVGETYQIVVATYSGLAGGTGTVDIS